MRRSTLALAAVVAGLYAVQAWALPPPRPSPRDFVVYFPAGSCSVAGYTEEVLSAAAQTVHDLSAERVLIATCTDTSASPPDIQKLAACRADVATARLVDKGVSRAAIATAATSAREVDGPALDRCINIHVGYERE